MAELIDTSEATAIIADYFDEICDTDVTFNENEILRRLNKSAVDAELVRHGMFIGTEYDGYADGNPVYYEWKCSECGCIFEENEPTYRYCPNCGARMDAERKEE